MSTQVSDIQSTNWQISTAGFGIVAEGLEDIRQCLDIILRTVKGSDSFRPEFGSDVFQYVDSPVNVAIPNIKRCIIEAVDIWEKRVKLKSILHYVEESHLTFVITYQLINQDIIDSLQLNIGGVFGMVSSGAGARILQAFYPPNPNGKAYNLQLILDGDQAAPIPPNIGFSTLNGMFTWAQNNLSYVGRWEMLVDRFLLYVSGSTYTSITLLIQLLQGISGHRVLLPVLEVGESFHMEISYELLTGASGSIELADGTFYTKDVLVNYLNRHYSYLGIWSIVAGSYDITGDFSGGDFGDDMFTGQGYFLQLESTTVASVTLTVTAV